MSIVILTGFAGAGKDTVADYLVSKHSFIKLSMAQKLKEGVAVIFGYNYKMLQGLTPSDREWREQKDEFWSSICGRDLSPRKILQEVGTECFRNIFSTDFWVGCVSRQINQYREQGAENFVISDARFMSEINFLRNEGGEVWEVKRPDKEPEHYKIVYEAKQSGKWNNPNIFDPHIKKIKETVHISELEWIYDNNPDIIINNDYTIDNLFAEIDELFDV